MKLKIPCTSANLGVLFDKGGVALDAFFNEIDIMESDKTVTSIEGLGADILPIGASNLICRAIDMYFNETNQQKPQYSLKMTNNIPLSRGLGSSAACIAGGMYAANLLVGSKLSDNEIIHMAARMEGHGDNVCPAVRGGFTIYKEDQIIDAGFTDEISFILFIPKTELNTKFSRGVLPDNYPDAIIEHAKNLEWQMTTALLKKDYEKAGYIMEQDVIHQPYRKEFLPYWNDVLKGAAEAGVYGTALSGAGPTMISMCSSGQCETILNKVRNAIDIKFGLSIMRCEICKNGLTVD